MKRAILIVMDGCGAGEAPDAANFGDLDHPSTIRHVWEKCGPLDLPNLTRIGFLDACGITTESTPNSRFGRLQEMSMGKDSVTGHWEMMGIHTEKPFPTYPNGFPDELIRAFEAKIGLNCLGNISGSGTQIIQEFGSEHMLRKEPIVYTSADSVFQIAAHEEIVPIEQLYEFCEVARKLCIEPNNVQRVIARPFVGSAANGFTRTGRRRDFPLPAPRNLIDDIGEVFGIGVVPELFNHRGFRPLERTQNNDQHAKMLAVAIKSDARFIFANFEDFDMLYGHRNDPKGFAQCLLDFDRILGNVLDSLEPDDILILTADHGNDPTSASTDHSREYVPVCVAGQSLNAARLGDRVGMWSVGATIANHLGVSFTRQNAALQY